MREPPADEISVETLRRYVAYARAKCAPRLNAAGMETLQNYYVSIRQNLHQQDAENKERGNAPRAVPITVRQLEAVVRISESVARMRLSDVANENDVQMAIHMFTVSTLEAAKMGEVEMEGGGGELLVVHQIIKYDETVEGYEARPPPTCAKRPHNVRTHITSPHDAHACPNHTVLCFAKLGKEEICSHVNWATVV